MEIEMEMENICAIKVEWDKNSVLKLINLWQEYPCLYNPRNQLYHNKHSRNEALEKITKNLQELIPDIKVNDVKVKISYLRSQYAREIQKQKEFTRSGMGTDEVYVPSVYWYDELKFLREYIKIRKGKNNLEMSQIISDEDSSPPKKISLDSTVHETKSQTVELSEEDDALKAATEALKTLANKKQIDPYIESFSNFVREHLLSIENAQERKTLIKKIMTLIIEHSN
ncbi:hypothetical protein FF38_01498 [Lucilia cuprina]|uniref:MADF domain-containing protein n=1 Tax=Lucilia cuprina TaxID=7375 RepID=A0A0L0BSP9_LUCCU|nr:hypothetical protein CVS40_11879 [Lucilia cuprina]KNC23067.1 hypothetical protein FF38_01498 [Lucilia cuprina]